MNRQSCRDGVFWIEDIDPSISGPFANQQEKTNGILERLARSEKAPYVRLVQEMVEYMATAPFSRMGIPNQRISWLNVLDVARMGA